MTKNVHVVDDSATMRRIILRGARRAGFDDAVFMEVGDRVEGLEAMTRGSFDLILCDVNMPDLKGVEDSQADNVRQIRGPSLN